MSNLCRICRICRICGQACPAFINISVRYSCASGKQLIMHLRGAAVQIPFQVVSLRPHKGVAAVHTAALVPEETFPDVLFHNASEQNSRIFFCRFHSILSRSFQSKFSLGEQKGELRGALYREQNLVFGQKPPTKLQTMSRRIATMINVRTSP